MKKKTQEMALKKIDDLIAKYNLKGQYSIKDVFELIRKDVENRVKANVFEVSNEDANTIMSDDLTMFIKEIGKQKGNSNIFLMYNKNKVKLIILYR